MKTYRVLNWTVIDDDGRGHGKGDIVKLSGKKADFYSGRLEEVDPKQIKREQKSDLPEDVPKRDILMEAGFDSLPKVHEATDKALLSLNGIGKSTLEDIRNYGNTGNTG